MAHPVRRTSPPQCNPGGPTYIEIAVHDLLPTFLKLPKDLSRSLIIGMGGDPKIREALLKAWTAMTESSK